MRDPDRSDYQSIEAMVRRKSYLLQQAPMAELIESMDQIQAICEILEELWRSPKSIERLKPQIQRLAFGY